MLEVEVGQLYLGKVKRMKIQGFRWKFSAEKDGLVHISGCAWAGKLKIFVKSGKILVKESH